LKSGKKIKAGSGGFSGKGFKFNEQEASLTDEKKKLQKYAFGLQMDSDDEDDNVNVSFKKLVFFFK
jgi:ATP-dependent RNA helicase DDX46/PRP5